MPVLPIGKDVLQGKTTMHMKLRKRNGPRAVSKPSLSELLPSGEIAVLYGTRRMTVRGCRKILAYAPTEILLQLKRQRLRVRGEGLACSSFSGGCTTLQGRIRSVSYEEGEVQKK